MREPTKWGTFVRQMVDLAEDPDKRVELEGTTERESWDASGVSGNPIRRGAPPVAK